MFKQLLFWAGNQGNHKKETLTDFHENEANFPAHNVNVMGSNPGYLLKSFLPYLWILYQPVFFKTDNMVTKTLGYRYPMFFDNNQNYHYEDNLCFAFQGKEVCNRAVL